MSRLEATLFAIRGTPLPGHAPREDCRPPSLPARDHAQARDLAVVDQHHPPESLPNSEFVTFFLVSLPRAFYFQEQSRKKEGLPRRRL